MRTTHKRLERIANRSSIIIPLKWLLSRMLWTSDKRRPTPHEVLKVYVFDNNSCDVCASFLLFIVFNVAEFMCWVLQFHASFIMFIIHRAECGETVCVRCSKSHAECVYPQRWSIIGWYQSSFALLTQRNRVTLMMMTQCSNISAFSFSYNFSPQRSRLIQTL